MDYLISFLEGIVTFLSPCLLPLLPVYVSYFAGQENENRKGAALRNAVGFVAGFTLVFVLLGAFAGTAGGFLKEYGKAVNLASGGIVILFGLNFMGVLRIPLLNKDWSLQKKTVKTGFFSSVLFGIIFSIGWTPCIGTFLGSALMLAAYGGQSGKGVRMLIAYSLGLGIPFLASAVLIDRLKSSFAFIKRHYRVVNLLSGGLLVIVGILMATGLMGAFLSLLTF